VQLRPSFCSHSNGPIDYATSPCKEVWDYLHKYLHKIHCLKVEIVLILVIIAAVTQIHGNWKKITAQGENHGNHGDCEFVIYIHPT